MNINIKYKKLIIVLEKMYQLKLPRFYLPIQLLIQGQWWSNIDTHQLHIEQCFDLAGFISLQVEQV